jgi:hypothetical protein
MDEFKGELLSGEDGEDEGDRRPKRKHYHPPTQRR